MFQIRAYDLADNPIYVQNVSGVSRFPVTIPVVGIYRVEVDFTGDFGFSLDDLQFGGCTPGAACDDGNACTTDDTCSGGVCVDRN